MIHKGNVYLVLIVVFITVLAFGCRLGQSSMQATTPSQKSSTYTPTTFQLVKPSPTIQLAKPSPTIQLAEPSPSMPMELSTCEASKWSIVPTRVFTGPSTGGFKNLFVNFGVKNDSQFWGKLDIITNYNTEDWPYVTSEGGFKYTPAELFFPQVNGKLGLYDELIPPGYAFSGIFDKKDPVPLSENISLDPNLLTLVFSVAESQNHFVLTFPTITVYCNSPNNPLNTYLGTESTGPIVIDLDKDVQEISHSLPSNNLLSITEPIQIPEATIQLTGIDYSEEEMRLDINLKFNNANVGYQTHGDLHVYLFREDGLLYRRAAPEGFISVAGVPFIIGPGQSQDIVLSNLVGKQERNLRLVLGISFIKPSITSYYFLYKLSY